MMKNIAWTIARLGMILCLDTDWNDEEYCMDNSKARNDSLFGHRLE